MPSKDRRIDAYIARSPSFAQPILKHLREVVHEACPEVQETLKWGSPYFTYHGMLCGMAAFKTHCAFGFWKGTQVMGEKSGSEEAMGQFGRIARTSDLPARRTIVRYVRVAMKLNEAGVPAARPPRVAPKRLIVPEDLGAALQENARARSTFENFSPSGRREYVEWLAEAKRPETRARRLKTAIAQLAEGKPHNWKYMRK